MILQYCSDLHLEFRDNRDFLKSYPLQPQGDILLLAGDIVPFAMMENYNDFFDWVSDHFNLTYWLPGNHEYYHGDAAKRSGTVHEKIRSNVHLVNNISFQQDQVKLVFSTLWTKIGISNQWDIERGMSDFHLIKFNGSRFSAENFNQLHLDCRRFLQQEINKCVDGKTVVISHHVPSFLNYPEKYKTDTLNEAFGVELFDFIESSKIDYWIFGHHHHNMLPFTIGCTSLLTNQLGYVKYHENLLFDPAKTILL